jgi:Phasin protein
MSHRYQAGVTDKSYAEQSQHVFFAPPAALSTWKQVSALIANAQEGFATIATEWQGFVSRRLQEDLTLTQRLSQCRTPEQILAAYTDFWHKAVEEYGKELTTMTKLATGVTRNMVLRAPSIAAEKPAESYASQKAAA